MLFNRRHCRFDRTAALVPRHHKQWYFEFDHTKLNAAQYGVVYHLAGRPNHKQFAQAAIKDDFRRYPRVDTAKDDGKGMLR